MEQRKKEAAQLEEVELQMLRAFAAHDHDKDGTKQVAACRSPRISTPSRNYDKFFLENAKSGSTGASPGNLFVSSCQVARHGSALTTLFLFQHFDEQKDGTVSAQLVRHLHETVAPTRLSSKNSEYGVC